ncbi:hypothetical protein V8F20_004110 [Naviculisporaceae sp. PSN 640]
MGFCLVVLLSRHAARKSKLPYEAPRHYSHLAHAKAPPTSTQEKHSLTEFPQMRHEGQEGRSCEVEAIRLRCEVGWNTRQNRNNKRENGLTVPLVGLIANRVYDGGSKKKAEQRQKISQGKSTHKSVQCQAVPVVDRDPSRQLRPTIRTRARLIGPKCPVRASKITRPVCVRKPNRQAGVDKVGKNETNKRAGLTSVPKANARAGVLLIGCVVCGCLSTVQSCDGALMSC